MQRAPRRGVVPLGETHGQARRDAHVRDPAPREAAADHAQVLHLARRDGLVDARIFPELGRRQEEVHQAMRRLADDELSERLRLELGRGSEAARGEALDHVEHAIRRGVVGVRPGPGVGARLPEEQRATDGVALERDGAEIDPLVPHARHVTDE